MKKIVFASIVCMLVLLRARVYGQDDSTVVSFAAQSVIYDSTVINLDPFNPSSMDVTVYVNFDTLNVLGVYLRAGDSLPQYSIEVDDVSFGALPNISGLSDSIYIILVGDTGALTRFDPGIPSGLHDTVIFVPGLDLDFGSAKIELFKNGMLTQVYDGPDSAYHNGYVQLNTDRLPSPTHDVSSYFENPGAFESMAGRNDGCFEPKAYTYTPPVLLPVELLSFTVKIFDGQMVLIEWITVAEINCDYFEVQKFSDTWGDWEYFIQESSKSKNGFSIEPQVYSLTAQLEEGVHYFRLKQVDLNGDFETFSQVVVEIPPPEENPRVVDVRFYDFTGREIPAPQGFGLLIEINEMSNGDYVSRKIH